VILLYSLLELLLRPTTIIWTYEKHLYISVAYGNSIASKNDSSALSSQLFACFPNTSPESCLVIPIKEDPKLAG